ncbi:hypothetical protein GCM10009759_46260 [Kitasatospora saccharophila]|uniref:Condensation domain-containing protein n=1 Tax=Kitasatospora saccharophila TaxID=407973 RepID=A0ABN2XAX6_9ACTN
MTASPYFPLAPEQRSMLFLEGLFGPGIFHNMSVTVRVPPGTGLPDVRRAVERLQDRHDALRSGLAGYAPLLQRLDPVPARVALPTAEPGETAAAQLTRRRRELLNAEQVRHRSGRAHYELIRSADRTEQYLLVSLDHFVCDSTAAGVVAADLERLLDGVDPGPAPAPFGELCRARSRAADPEREAGHWNRLLSGVGPLTGLAPRPPAGPAPTRGQVDTVIAGPTHHDRLAALSDRHGATPFSVMAALTAVAVWHRTGQRDFAFFTPVSTRQDADAAAVGCFAHDRPVVGRVDPDGTLAATVRSLLAGYWRSYRNSALAVPDLAHQVPAFGRTLLAGPVDYLQLHVWMEPDAPGAVPRDSRTESEHGEFTPAHDLTVTTLRFGLSPNRTTVRAYFGGPAPGRAAAERLGADVLALLATAAEPGDHRVGELARRALD